MRNFHVFLGAVTLLVACGVLLPAFACAAADDQPDSLRWQHVVNESVALVGPQGVIWQFNFDKKLTKPYFHPVALPSGEVLTWSQPPDHPWHHALWFSWKTINGVNYWEEDRKTGQANGKTSWSHVNIETDDDGRATISMDLSYSLPNQPPVLTEKRTVRISAPNDKDQRYSLDWCSTFTAGSVDVTLDRTPVSPAPNAKPWGGYAGLSIRFAKDLTQRQPCTVHGPAEFKTADRHRSRGPAMDYNGLIGGHPVGMAILDHPANLRHPTPWYVIRSTMSYLNPALLTYEPYTLKAGQTFTLQYRIIVHPNRWDGPTLQSAFDAYSAEKQSNVPEATER